MDDSAPTKFTVNLEPADDARFEQLTRALADELGRVPSHRGRRYPSRADLLRAMLAVTVADSAVLAAVVAQVRADAAQRGG